MNQELPDISVDVDRWARAQLWSWREAEYLLVGLDPWKILQISPDVPLDLKGPQRAKARDALDFHFRFESVPERVTPTAALEIATRAGLHPPQDLSDAVKEFAASVQDASPGNFSDGHGFTRKYNKLLKVFLAVAIQRYGYNSNLRRQPAIASIRSDAEQLGIKVDDETIRQRLREASEQLEAAEEEGVSAAMRDR